MIKTLAQFSDPNSPSSFLFVKRKDGMLNSFQLSAVNKSMFIDANAAEIIAFIIRSPAGAKALSKALEENVSTIKEQEDFDDKAAKKRFADQF